QNQVRGLICPRADGTTNFYLPVNLFHIDLELAFIDQVTALGERLIVIRGDATLSKAALQNAVLGFQMHLGATFTTQHVLEKHHLMCEAFDWVLGEVESKFNQALVNPSDMCGTLAAQSI
ncbi:RNA polymerase Rpb1, domain 6-domain-containing protein, partial [Mycena alexandri]